MIIKCGRREFEVNSLDLILDNGACYQLITKSYFDHWCDRIPIVSKKLFNQLKKSGKIILSQQKYMNLYDLWEFVEEEQNVASN